MRAYVSALLLAGCASTGGATPVVEAPPASSPLAGTAALDASAYVAGALRLVAHGDHRDLVFHLEAVGDLTVARLPVIPPDAPCAALPHAWTWVVAGAEPPTVLALAGDARVLERRGACWAGVELGLATDAPLAHAERSFAPGELALDGLDGPGSRGAKLTFGADGTLAFAPSPDVEVTPGKVDLASEPYDARSYVPEDLAEARDRKDLRRVDVRAQRDGDEVRVLRVVVHEETSDDPSQQGGATDTVRDLAWVLARGADDAWSTVAVDLTATHHQSGDDSLEAGVAQYHERALAADDGGVLVAEGEQITHHSGGGFAGGDDSETGFAWAVERGGERVPLTPEVAALEDESVPGAQTWAGSEVARATVEGCTFTLTTDALTMRCGARDEARWPLVAEVVPEGATVSRALVTVVDGRSLRVSAGVSAEWTYEATGDEGETYERSSQRRALVQLVVAPATGLFEETRRSSYALDL